MILRAMFFEEETLNDIISDQACGATLIFKVLTTPFLDESLKPECVENVRNALIRLKAQPNHGYKRLMDEVSLSTRHGGTPANDSRSESKHRQSNGHLSHLDNGQNGFSRLPYGSRTPQHQRAPFQRTSSMDSSNFEPYANGLATPQYAHSPGMTNLGPSPQQLQYQQALLAQAQAQAQSQMQRPPGFYPTPMTTGNVLQHNGMYAANASPVGHMGDPYRQQAMNGSPMMVGAPGLGMQNGAFQAQQGFGANGMMGGMGYGAYGVPQYFPQQQAQMAGQGRRARVSGLPETA